MAHEDVHVHVHNVVPAPIPVTVTETTQTPVTITVTEPAPTPVAVTVTEAAPTPVNVTITQPTQTPVLVTIEGTAAGDAGLLTGSTLASNVVNSSLTSVGTLTSLAVTGLVTAASFSGSHSGSGAFLTGIPNSATTATQLNTASAIVARDTNGNFTAGAITAALTGNASTATTLQTARLINGVSFNGSANITISRLLAQDARTVSVAPSGASAQYATTVLTSWGNNNTPPYADSIVFRSHVDASAGGDNMISIRKDGDFGMRVWRQAFGSSSPFYFFKEVAWTDGSNATGTWTIATTGNAGTATTLATARNINGVSFNGSADITVTAAAGTLTGSTLAAGVTGSSLTSVGTITSGTWSGLFGAVSGANLTSLNATNISSGTIANARTTATNANTASAIVARDASGNFSAGTITAALTGNASTATTLQTARTINGVSFNGSANITVAAAAGTLTGTTLASNVVASSLTSVGTLDSLTVTGTISSNGISNFQSYGVVAGFLAYNRNGGSGHVGFYMTSDVGKIYHSAYGDVMSFNSSGTVTAATFSGAHSGSGASLTGIPNSATTATALNTASAIVARDVSGNFTAGTITAALSGNASTATTLQTARTINGVSFNGSADITIPMTGAAEANALLGTTLATNVVTSSLTSVGALTAGSIASGFGNINIGTNTFTGNGSGLTTLNATNLSSGTVPSARISGSYTGITGIGTIANSPTFISTGTVNGSGADAPVTGLQILNNTANKDAFLTFHVSGDTAGYLGMGGAEGDLVWGGFSYTTNRYRIYHSGNIASLTLPNLTSSGYLSITAASDGNGNIRFSAANPYIKASSYIVMPGGLYVSGGVLYVQGTCNVRGAIGSDTGNFLVNGGSNGVTGWASGGFGSSASTSGYQTIMWNTTFGTIARLTSKRATKDRITPLDNTGTVIDALRPVSFIVCAPEDEETPDEKAWREADVQHGFIAEEVAEVDEGRWAVWEPDEEGGIRPAMWRQHDLIALLVAEVKSLRTRVAALETTGKDVL
jgi:hypothetical protein